MKDTSPHLSPLCPPLEPSPISAPAAAQNPRASSGAALPASDKSAPSNSSASSPAGRGSTSISHISLPHAATRPRFARALRTEEMTADIAREAIEWQNERNRRIAGITKKLPLDLLPATGMYAIADDNFHVAAASLYLEKETPVAVCGFLFVNPDAPVRLVRQAVRLILAAMPVYAKKQGAKYLISTFGRPSFNRILDQIGFVTAETAENKIMKL